MPSVVVTKHALAEGLGRIEPVLREHGVDIEKVGLHHLRAVGKACSRQRGQSPALTVGDRRTG
jgi:hypothetical protein